MSQNTNKLPKDFFENIVLHTLNNHAGKFNVQSAKHYILVLKINIKE